MEEVEAAPSDETYVEDGLECAEYAEILADTIHHCPDSLTVGVFGKMGAGKAEILDTIRERLKSLTDFENTKLKVNVFSLLYRLIFFYPQRNARDHEHDEVKYIYVDVNVLDYQGSDKVWAGIATRIATEVDQAFGRWAIKLFRMWHWKPNKHLDLYLDDLPKKEVENPPKGRWRGNTCADYLELIIVLLLIAIFILCWVFFGVPGMPSASGEGKGWVSGGIGVSLGIVALTKVVDAGKILFQCGVSQVRQIAHLANKADLSKEIGFMGKVRNEIRYMVAAAVYMSLILKKKIRFVLMIDDIALLELDKVLKVFEVATLLDGACTESPFIQIMALESILQPRYTNVRRWPKLPISKFTQLMRCMKLPFHVPPMDLDAKRNFLIDQRLTRKRKRKHASKADVSHDDNLEVKLLDGNKDIELGDMQHVPLKDNFEKVHRKVLASIMNNTTLLNLLTGNRRTIKRIYRTVLLAVQYLELNSDSELNAEETAALSEWITLVDQWPYRTTWTRQVMLDNVQNHELNREVPLYPDDMTLFEVFQAAIPMLTFPDDWGNFLEMDGDPELFRHFLKEFPLNVGQMKMYLPITPNLDRSLMDIIANSVARKNIEDLAAPPMDAMAESAV